MIAVKAPHGDHHQYCHIHDEYFVRTGHGCDKCADEAERQARRERDEREEAKKKCEQDAAEAWFKDTGKTRKSRSPDKVAKKGELA